MVQGSHELSAGTTKPVTDKDERSGILVLGMHRSGTSAMTRVLNLLGAELGDHLLGPGFSNEQGFWEHLDAYRINDQLLTSLGMSWDDPRRLPENWTGTAHYTRALQAIAQVLSRDFGQSRMWAVKDPRICRLVPLWCDALKQMKVRPIAVFALRHPDEIAGSLAIRNGLSRDQVHLLWARHLCEAELATRGMRRCVIRYERLLADWRAEMTQAAEAAGLEWRVSLEDAAPDIDAFLNPESRHHRRWPSDARQNGSGESWIDKLFSAYCDIAENDDWSAAGAITDAFVQNASLWDGYLDEVYSQHGAAKAQLQALAVERSKHESVGDMLESMRSTMLVTIAEVEERLRTGTRADSGATDQLVTRLAHSIQTAVREEGNMTREQETAKFEMLRVEMEHSRQQEIARSEMLRSEMEHSRQQEMAKFEMLRNEMEHSRQKVEEFNHAFSRHHLELDAMREENTRLQREVIVARQEVKQQEARFADISAELHAKLDETNAALIYARLPWYKRIKRPAKDNRRKNG